MRVFRSKIRLFYPARKKKRVQFKSKSSLSCVSYITEEISDRRGGVRKWARDTWTTTPIVAREKVDERKQRCWTRDDWCTSNRGTENFGGATATSGDLVFAAGTLDKMFRAFDSNTGEELWSYELPFIGSAPPTSYAINNEQYVILPASGGVTLKIFYGDLVEQGDAILAFKIPK